MHSGLANEVLVEHISCPKYNTNIPMFAYQGLLFVFQKKAAFPLARRDFYRKTIQEIGESPPGRVQEYETTYISSLTFYLM